MRIYEFNRKDKRAMVSIDMDKVEAVQVVTNEQTAVLQAFQTHFVTMPYDEVMNIWETHNAE